MRQKRKAWAENLTNLRRQSQEASVGCLIAKLNLGVTFCNLAATSRDLRKYSRQLGSARNVLHDVEHLMWKLPMQSLQRNEMTAQKELLTLKLQQLDVRQEK